MFEKILFYSLTTLTVSWVLTYLNKATTKEAVANERGTFLLRMHKLYYYLGILSLLIAVVFIIVPPFVDNMDLPMISVMFIVLVIFGGIGLMCVLYFKNHYLAFNDFQVEVSNQFGKVKTVLWADFIKVKFNPTLGLLVLTSKTGEKVKIHQHLVGLTQFVKLLEAKRGWAANDIKFPISKRS